MRSTIAALGLLTATSLIANECCEPCEPCCVPKPKKCIDCECYTPAFYDLQCDWGAFFDIEFLYWYAGETNTAYALKLQTVPRNPQLDDHFVVAPVSYKHISKSWDPGLRIGIGWNDSCDGWDTHLNWTYYRNKSKNSTKTTPFIGVPFQSVPSPSQPAQVSNGGSNFGLINPQVNPALATGEGLTLQNQILGDHRSQYFSNVSAKWQFTFNSIDLEIGRKYWLSQCFNLRPFAALRGAWIKRSFRTTSSNVFDDMTLSIDIVDKIRLTNRTWGVGFVGGFQPTWYYCSNFAIYATIDAALLWGESKNKNRERYSDLGSDPAEFSSRANSNFFQMTAILDTGLGLRWEETWCCDRYRTTLDLGWEHHIWFDQNHRNQNLDNFAVAGTPKVSGFRTFTETSGNIGFGGFVLRLRWDF